MKTKSKKRHLLLSLPVLLSIFTSCGVLSSESTEKALVYSHDNEKLKWVSCPDFLPCEVAPLNGALGTPNNDVFIRFPGKAKIPFHTHSSNEHMVLIEGEFHTTYVGQNRVILKAGDYAYGPGNLAHDGYCASDEACIMFVAYETAIDAVPYPSK